MDMHLYFQALMNKLDLKNDELSNIGTTLNSLKTRCGPSEFKATAKQLNSLQNRMQTCHEKAKKV